MLELAQFEQAERDFCDIFVVNFNGKGGGGVTSHTVVPVLILGVHKD